VYKRQEYGFRTDDEVGLLLLLAAATAVAAPMDILNANACLLPSVSLGDSLLLAVVVPVAIVAAVFSNDGSSPSLIV